MLILQNKDYDFQKTGDTSVIDKYGIYHSYAL